MTDGFWICPAVCRFPLQFNGKSPKKQGDTGFKKGGFPGYRPNIPADPPPSCRIEGFAVESGSFPPKGEQRYLVFVYDREGQADFLLFGCNNSLEAGLFVQAWQRQRLPDASQSVSL